MLLSRIRPSGDKNAISRSDSEDGNFPKLQDFLEKRDFVGALTLLEFQRSINQMKSPGMIAYCCFHLGDYKRALEEYEQMSKAKKENEKELEDSTICLNIACCYFSQGMYKESLEAAEKGSDCSLKTRLLFHLAHKMDNEETVQALHRKLEETLENQLSLASIHYLRQDFQNSIDIYKRILLDNSLGMFPEESPEFEKMSMSMMSLMRLFRSKFTNDIEIAFIKRMLDEREYVALNVYVALCYHRLEYFDVSQEVLAVYLQAYPGSAIARIFDRATHSDCIQERLQRKISNHF